MCTNVMSELDTCTQGPLRWVERRRCLDGMECRAAATDTEDWKIIQCRRRERNWLAYMPTYLPTHGIFRLPPYSKHLMLQNP